MKLDKLPIYYRFLKKSEISNSCENEDDNGKRIISSFHETDDYRPTVFYKAISKILAFGINKKQNI